MEFSVYDERIVIEMNHNCEGLGSKISLKVIGKTISIANKIIAKKTLLYKLNY